jgi:hypothetical protein
MAKCAGHFRVNHWQNSSTMKPMLRNLRIAFSASCLIACLLLIALWTRSYKTFYWCYGLPHGDNVVHIQATQGMIILFVRQNFRPPAWEIGSVPLKGFGGQDLTRACTGIRNGITITLGKVVARLPVWLVALLMLVCAMVPWEVSRFNLRTLLLAITTVAVVLGSAVYAARK